MATSVSRRSPPPGLRRGDYFDRVRTPRKVAEEAAGSAITLRRRREPEAGSYPVVVSPGWGGVMCTSASATAWR